MSTGNLKTSISVFDFEDFGEFLASVLRESKKSGNKLTYTSIASSITGTSASRLKMIGTGKRKPDLELVKKICILLELSERERAHLESTVNSQVYFKNEKVDSALINEWDHVLENEFQESVQDLPFEKTIYQAKTQLLEGNLEAAKQLIIKSEASSRSSEQLRDARLFHAQIMRNTDNCQEALSILQSIPREEKNSLDNAVVDYDIAITNYLGTRDTGKLKSLTSCRNSIIARNSKLFLFAAGASPQTSMSRDERDTTILGRIGNISTQVIGHDEESKRNLKSLGYLAAKISSLQSADEQLLAYAYIFRFLRDMGFQELSTVSGNRYHSLSRRVSGNRNSDVLGLVPNLQHSSHSDKELDQLTSHTNMKTTKWRRMAQVSKSGSSILLKWVGSRLSGKSSQEALIDSYVNLATYAGRLKGPLMKLGQAATYLGLDMPPEVRNSLNQLSDQADPVDKKIMEDVFTESLKSPPQEIFAHWTGDPIAAGSMGQVFLAQTHSGDSVAVKIQYPNMRDVVKNDIASFSLLKPVLLKTFPNWPWREFITKVQKSLLDECRYDNEAIQQIQFAEMFSGDPKIIVPRVLPELCTDQIITTEYINGLSFNEFMQSASQTEKNKAGETIGRVCLTSILVRGLLQTDPNPGNYLFCGNGKVACLDFGNVEFIDPVMMGGLQGFLVCGIHRDFETFKNAIFDLKFLPADTTVDMEALFDEFLKLIPSRIGSSEPLPYTPELIRKELEFWMSQPFLRSESFIQPDLIFALRNYIGLFYLLGQLKAEADWQKLALSVLKGAPFWKGENSKDAL